MEAREDLPQGLRIGEIRNAEEVGVPGVEAAAWRDENVLLLQQVQREALVIEVRKSRLVDANKGVQGALGGRDEQVRAGGNRIDDHPS